MANAMKPILSFAVTLLLAACAITRVEPPPPVTPPAQYKEAWSVAKGADGPCNPG